MIDKSKRLWVGSIITMIGMLSSFINLSGTNRVYLYWSMGFCIIGVIIFRLGCDSWF